MLNTQKVVNVLLVATALSAVAYQIQPKLPPAPGSMRAFLMTESSQQTFELYLPVEQLEEAPEAYGPVYRVTATAYQAVEAQTDDEPFVTADNSFIKPDYSSKLRWLAISQDLLVHWGGKIHYGDQVQVRGVSMQLDGVYTVHDTMNKRHHHCIDILSNPSEKFDIFTKGVKIQRVAAAVTKRPATRPLLASNRPNQGKRLAWRRQRPSFAQPTEWSTYLASTIL